MNDARTRLFLAAAAGLLPGLLGGFFLTPPVAPSALTPSTHADEAALGAGQMPSTDGNRSTPEGVHESAVETAGGAVSRRADATSLDESASAAPALSELDPAAASILRLHDELALLLASGRIEEKLAQSPDILLDLMVRLKVETGDVKGALALLEKQSEVGASTWEQLYQLAYAADPLVAAAAIEHAIELQLASATTFEFEYPMASYLQQQMSVDPARALATLALMRARGMTETPATTLFEATALAQNGQRDRARDLLVRAMEDPEQYVQALATLIQVDSAAAEGSLRQALTGNWGDWARGQLLGLLTGQGRNAEAIEMFESAIAEGRADSTNWSQMLSNLPPGTVDAEIARWLELGPVGLDIHQSLANYYASKGETQKALDAYENVWKLALEQGGWLPGIPYEVIDAHPGQVLAMLDDAVAKLPENDEMWGDVADSYWMAGEHALAVSAWEHAKLLDPGDGEWTGKIESAASGGSPVWTNQQSALGDTSDLWPEPAPITLFDQNNGGNYEHWESSDRDFVSSSSFAGEVLNFHTSTSAPTPGGTLQQLGYLGYTSSPGG